MVSNDDYMVYDMYTCMCIYRMHGRSHLTFSIDNHFDYSSGNGGVVCCGYGGMVWYVHMHVCV